MENNGKQPETRQNCEKWLNSSRFWRRLTATAESLTRRRECAKTAKTLQKQGKIEENDKKSTKTLR